MLLYRLTAVAAATALIAGSAFAQTPAPAAPPPARRPGGCAGAARPARPGAAGFKPLPADQRHRTSSPP